MDTSMYNVKTFDEDVIFDNYHHYELFDDSKEYNTETFEHNYGKGLYNYRYCKHIIQMNDIVKNYIVAEQQLTTQQQELYAPYCQCPKCTAPWYSSWSYCACCYGCLKSAFPQQYVMNKTIAHFNEL